MVADIIVGLIVLGLLGGLIYAMASPNRYAEMTEEEFEDDAKKGSPLGAAMLGMERVLRRREAEMIIQQKERVEKDEAAVGGEPPEENGGKKE